MIGNLVARTLKLVSPRKIFKRFGNRATLLYSSLLVRICYCIVFAIFERTCINN